MSNHLMAREWGDVLNRDAEELQELGTEEAFVFVQAQGSQRCRRPDYLSDPCFAGAFDPNERFSLVAALEREKERDKKPDKKGDHAPDPGRR
jgi:hypothetical protein